MGHASGLDSCIACMGALRAALCTKTITVTEHNFFYLRRTTHTTNRHHWSSRSTRLYFQTNHAGGLEPHIYLAGVGDRVFKRVFNLMPIFSRHSFLSTSELTSRADPGGGGLLGTSAPRPRPTRFEAASDRGEYHTFLNTAHQEMDYIRTHGNII